MGDDEDDVSSVPLRSASDLGAGDSGDAEGSEGSAEVDCPEGDAGVTPDSLGATSAGDGGVGEALDGTAAELVGASLGALGAADVTVVRGLGVGVLLAGGVVGEFAGDEFVGGGVDCGARVCTGASVDGSARGARVCTGASVDGSD